MTCRLLKNIKHTCEYDAGGITSIYLLDIRDFVSYTFREDKLYTEGYVESIRAAATYREISTVDESNFTETQENGIFKQELTTFVRSLDAEKLSGLLVAANNKYLVTFRTSQGRAFSFGSDSGASLSFSQTTGQMGAVSGYAITFSKKSIYPLFEVSVDAYKNKPIWILEKGIWSDKGVWLRDGIWKTV